MVFCFTGLNVSKLNICLAEIKDNACEKSILIFEKGLDFRNLLWYCCVLTGGTNIMDKRITHYGIIGRYHSGLFVIY